MRRSNAELAKLLRERADATDADQLSYDNNAEARAEWAQVDREAAEALEEAA